MPAKTSARPQRDVSLVLPAVLILALYSAFIALVGAPHVKEVSQLTKDLEAAERESVSPLEVAKLQDKKDAKAKQLEELKVQQAAWKTKAEQLGAGVDSPLKGMKLLQDISAVFTRHGLTVTQDNAANTRSTKLAKSFTDAKRNLLDTMKKALQPTGAAARYIPPGIDPEFLPPELREQLSVGNANVNAADLQLRELQIWGTYQDMTRALRSLSKECGQSVAIGLSLERPARMEGTGLLFWKVTVHVEPAFDSDGSEEPETEDKLVRNVSR